MAIHGADTVLESDGIELVPLTEESDGLLSDFVDDEDLVRKSAGKPSHSVESGSDVPSLWQWKYVGLYTNYALIGWVYSLSGSTATGFCFYVWDVEDQDTCQAARNVIQMGWNFKFFVAVLCESYRPFGYRRKPYIVIGWIGAIVLMAVLAVFADPAFISYSTYVILCMIATCCYIVADVNADELWQVLHGKPLMLLMIYASGATALAGVYNVAAVTIQFRIIELDQFQNGLDTVSTYLVLVLAIHIFKTFCLNMNWRYTEIASKMLYAVLGLLWLLPIYDIWGTRNAWFTIFIDLNEAFASGLTQVLYSMAVVEIAEVGLEATTYEFLISICNVSITLASVVTPESVPSFAPALAVFCCVAVDIPSIMEDMCSEHIIES
eukprot:gene10892-12887_t